MLYKISKVVSFNFERLSIFEVAVYNFQDRLRQTHAHQRERNFSMAVDLSQLEETSRDLCGILQEKISTITP